MIVCTFNVRGLGGRVKRRRITQLIIIKKIDFMALQETKMEEISEDLCFNLWGGDRL
jgi:exonuclease III